MGPSGSGKTTLLNVIGMLDDFNEGEYSFLNQSVHNLKEKHRANLFKDYIGFVFQAYHKAMVADMLDKFNIVGKKDLFPAQLSGGQQQLVGVARALVGSPKLILADEPTGNLNSKQGVEIMEIFKELNEGGVTIIQVTHSEKNATYGSRTMHLLDGRNTNN
jgi:ABC-type lipoprotein export system ATPase subunit